jgi:hypothetical protein
MDWPDGAGWGRLFGAAEAAKARKHENAAPNAAKIRKHEIRDPNEGREKHET